MSLAQVKDLCNEAGSLCDLGSIEEALGKAREAVKICRTQLGVHHYGYPLCLTTLGWIYATSGQRDEAVTCFNQAIDAANKLEGFDFEYTVTTLTHAADFFQEVGSTIRQRQLQDQILCLYERHLGADHPRYFMARAEFLGKV